MMAAMIETGLFLLAAAMVLDAILGEPDWLWRKLSHPVVAMGNLLKWLERSLNAGDHRVARGGLALLALLTPVIGTAILIASMPYGWLWQIIGAAVLLAHRSLVQHVGGVDTALTQSLQQGRSAVAMIVGRDPAALDEAGVSRAAIESAAENFSDGVVAPAFWFAVAGLPGIAAYKAINTADSMIGYRNDRYGEFGRIAARVDDLVNLIPARLTGLLFCAVGGANRNAWNVMLRDSRQHRSPNAGWPEAAMAASLGIRLSGPRLYPGQQPVNDPWMNADGLDAVPGDVGRAVHLLWRAWGAALAVIMLGGVLSAGWVA